MGKGVGIKVGGLENLSKNNKRGTIILDSRIQISMCSERLRPKNRTSEFKVEEYTVKGVFCLLVSLI